MSKIKVSHLNVSNYKICVYQNYQSVYRIDSERKLHWDITTIRFILLSHFPKGKCLFNILSHF